MADDRRDQSGCSAEQGQESEMDLQSCRTVLADLAAYANTQGMQRANTLLLHVMGRFETRT